MSLHLIRTAALLLAITAISACAMNAPPKTSHDGLELQADTKFDQLYLRPGASLSGFTEYGIEPCEVAFRKNWLRDQNANRVDLNHRVTQRNIDKIKDSLAASCGKYLRQALAEEPAYTLTDNFDEGEAVLILRPSIINLDINAPDTDGPGITRNFTTSFGEMTLSLDMVDGTTGEVLARAVDRRRGYERGFLQWTNGVTNKADADRIIRRWAKQLRSGLDQARAQ